MMYGKCVQAKDVVTDVDINDEFNNVLKWAGDNRMIVNICKKRNSFS